MIDAVIRFAPAHDAVAVDLWDGDLPMLPDMRAIQVEPRRWWVFGAPDIADAIGDRGAASPFGGGLMRATITGPGWRTLLSISALFDVEHPGFGVGQVASTVIHHVPVRIVVVGPDVCDLYCPASLAGTLESLWRTATAGGTDG
ncbi:MAG TPA: sarcosine oxidase subunit gamma [Sphingomonas sp.]|uniref:sarcosine oxidase subunit gamma n=1 Tax=Sphingomonas sp. TaxID=28214 RepID=UPI002ED94653